MELIDKIAVTTEIDKLITSLRKSCNPNPLGTMIECLTDAQIEALSILKESIEDINAREVDLETAFTALIDHFDEKNNYGQWSESDLRQFAEHFFKLGLKAQKGE